MEGKARPVGSRGLGGAEGMVGDQLIENLALTLLGKSEVSHRVVVRGRLGKPGEHGGLGPVELAWVNSEIASCGVEVAPVAVPVVDGVQIHLEHLILGVGEGEVQAQTDLFQSAPETAAQRVDLFRSCWAIVLPRGRPSSATTSAPLGRRRRRR